MEVSTRSKPSNSSVIPPGASIGCELIWKRFLISVGVMLILVAFICPANGQAIKELEGKFYISADNSCVVLLNGKEILTSQYKKLEKVSTSESIKIAMGDHLVFKLHNAGGPKGLLVLFATNDGKLILHFPKSAFKLLPNLERTNFTDLEFRDARAVREAKHPDGDKILPNKGRSERVWGETATCALAFVVTRELITPVLPR